MAGDGLNLGRPRQVQHPALLGWFLLFCPGQGSQESAAASSDHSAVGSVPGELQGGHWASSHSDTGSCEPQSPPNRAEHARLRREKVLGIPDGPYKGPSSKSAKSFFKSVCFNLRILIAWKLFGSVIYHPARILRSLAPYVPLPFLLLYTYHFPLFIFPD